jgi:micrococcal nuclease
MEDEVQRGGAPELFSTRKERTGGVQEGFAWAYREYLHGPCASEYIDAENDARSKHLGLWNQMNPQPPWEFRKRLKMGR